jgi:hypothetical protein
MHRRATTIRCPRHPPSTTSALLVALSATRGGPAERYACPICLRVWSVRDARILARADQAGPARPAQPATEGEQLRLPEA